MTTEFKLCIITKKYKNGAVLLKLRVDTIHVKQVIFGDSTYIKNGVLTIDRKGLCQLLMSPVFESLDLELASPGESCRISGVGDVIRPMVASGGWEASFPGTLGRLCQAGDGRLVELSGVAVVETWELPAMSKTFIDMSGPGVKYSPFSQTYNLVIIAKPVSGVERTSYARELKKASLKAAAILAQTAVNEEPDECELFCLGGVSDVDAEGKKLPRVVYIYQVFSHQTLAEPLFYGDNCRGMLPTPVHPNEILAGALVNNCYEQVHNADTTYVIQTHPVIKELYRRHGKDLYFAGVILKNTPSAQKEKERMAMIAAAQAKNLFHADAAIITKEGGGHPQIDMAMTCQACEKQGVKTALMLTEFLVNDGSREEVLIFSNPEADAIVSAGYCETVEFPPVDRVCGSMFIPDISVPMNEGFSCMCKLVRGSLSQLGDSWLRSKER